MERIKTRSQSKHTKETVDEDGFSDASEFSSKSKRKARKMKREGSKAMIPDKERKIQGPKTEKKRSTSIGSKKSTNSSNSKKSYTRSKTNLR